MRLLSVLPRQYHCRKAASRGGKSLGYITHAAYVRTCCSSGLIVLQQTGRVVPIGDIGVSRKRSFRRVRQRAALRTVQLGVGTAMAFACPTWRLSLFARKARLAHFVLEPERGRRDLNEAVLVRRACWDRA